jgi:hypothetical protein
MKPRTSEEQKAEHKAASDSVIATILEDAQQNQAYHDAIHEACVTCCNYQTEIARKDLEIQNLQNDLLMARSIPKG